MHILKMFVAYTAYYSPYIKLYIFYLWGLSVTFCTIYYSVGSWLL